MTSKGNGGYRKKPRHIRETIPMGAPEALSWEDTPWEYDDFAVQHSATEGLTLLEIGDLMGFSREMARQINSTAEAKLRNLRAVGFNTDEALVESVFTIREIFDRWDNERLTQRLHFAEKLCEDEELQERIRDVYGNSLFSDDIDFSILRVFAEKGEHD